MIGVSRGAVWTAALVLASVAGVGSYLGYSRAAAAPGGSADADTYVTPKKATSVDAAAPPPVDENYIRKIAHDEAVAVLHPPRKTPSVVASSDDDSSDDSDDDKTPGANPPTPPPVTAAPVATPKPPPPPPTGLY